MSEDRLVPLVIDRPGAKNRLQGPEQTLEHPELFVFERHLLGTQTRVRPEHPFAVIAGFLGHFLLVDLESLPRGFQVLPVPLVADQGFLPLLQLLAQSLQDRFPVGRILAGLLLTYCRPPITTSLTFRGEGSFFFFLSG